LRYLQGEQARRPPAWAWGVVLLLLASAAPQTEAGGPPLSVAAEQQLLDKYCRTCHNFVDWAGSVEFEDFDPGKPYQSAETAEQMLVKLRSGMMPPVGKPRPDWDEVRAFATNLESQIDSHANPRYAMPRLHRLNRSEYENAIRDLLVVDVDASKLLPTDDSSRGFDNQAGTLTLSASLLEAYLSAAAHISQLAIGTATSPTQVTYSVPGDTTQSYHVDGLPFGTRGGLLIKHDFPADGTYTFRIYSVNLGNMGNFRPFGDVAGEQLLVYVDGKRVQKIDWDKALHVTRFFGDPSALRPGQKPGARPVAPPSDDEDAEADPEAGQLRTIDVKVPMTAGPHRVGVTFLATDYAPGLDMNRHFDRSTIETGGIPGFTFYPHIGRVRIDGPVNGTEAKDSPSRERIFLCRPKSESDEEPCARKIATTLARRAYRGFETPADIATLMKFYALGRQGGTFDDGIGTLLQRMLADPKFIFRVESAPQGLPAGTPYRVSDLDLASRLSFFLWSSIPDDELLTLAEKGDLHKDGVLRAQIRRMLDDPRAAALTINFADQWLGLRALTAFDPVVESYPDFDDNLRQAERHEVELFFTSILEEDRSVVDLLTAKYTFLNDRLAVLYGIPGVQGSDFRRVVLDDSQSNRWGLLGKGGILAITSHPDRTSPTVRGKWVLKTLLGSPPPDPPAVVPQLKPTKVDPAGNARPLTLRELMEQHRASPTCASCHKFMDPIGFALEPFDAIGHFRTNQDGTPIDPKSVLYDGGTVDGPAGVRAFVLRHRDQYVRNVVENLMTYALGRGVEYYDMPLVRRVLQETSGNDYRLRGLVEAVAMSDEFRMNATLGPAVGQKTAATGTSASGRLAASSASQGARTPGSGGAPGTDAGGL
jgi:Protein of unknown function (DUF1592)/Protein of unknown function (DUF1588)/Protein of unknown function (DUF1587)/Protein of unknown function (DUF1585)/Protein of unknown function (DUF1595)